MCADGDAFTDTGVLVPINRCEPVSQSISLWTNRSLWSRWDRKVWFSSSRNVRVACINDSTILRHEKCHIVAYLFLSLNQIRSALLPLNPGQAEVFCCGPQGPLLVLRHPGFHMSPSVVLLNHGVLWWSVAQVYDSLRIFHHQPLFLNLREAHPPLRGGHLFFLNSVDL